MIEGMKECCLPRGARLSAKASSPARGVSELSTPAFLHSVFVRGVAVYCGVSAEAAVAGLCEGYLSSPTTPNDRHQ